MFLLEVMFWTLFWNCLAPSTFLLHYCPKETYWYPVSCHQTIRFSYQMDLSINWLCFEANYLATWIRFLVLDCLAREQLLNSYAWAILCLLWRWSQKVFSMPESLSFEKSLLNLILTNSYASFVHVLNSSSSNHRKHCLLFWDWLLYYPSCL